MSEYKLYFYFGLFGMWVVGRCQPPSMVANYISHMTFLSPWHIPSFASVMIVTSPPGISCACLKYEAICLGKKKIPGFFFFFFCCPNFLTNLVEIFCEGFILVNKLILQTGFLQLSQPSEVPWFPCACYLQEECVWYGIFVNRKTYLYSMLNRIQLFCVLSLSWWSFA